MDSRPKYREVPSSSERAACITPKPKISTIKSRGQLLSFFVRRGTQSHDEFIAAVPFRPRLSMMLGMINTSDIFSIGENACACTSSGRRVTRARALGTTRTMTDEDEGEQHAAAGEIRPIPMLSIKQVLALIPFSRATLYREMEAGRFPAAHEIAPRRIAWFKDDVAAWQLGTKKGA